MGENFPMDWGGNNDLGMIQVHYIYYALYFYFYSTVTYNEILIIIIFLMLGLWGFIILSYVFFWLKIVGHNKSTIKSQ